MGEILHNITSQPSLPGPHCRGKTVQSLAFVLAAILSVLFCGAFAISFFCCSGHPPTMKLNDKLNPNYAPAASLARLPGIGIVRAQAIITYRQKQESMEKRPFRTVDDLRNVKGIGVKTTKNITQWVNLEQ